MAPGGRTAEAPDPLFARAVPTLTARQTFGRWWAGGAMSETPRAHIAAARTTRSTVWLLEGEAHVELTPFRERLNLDILLRAAPICRRGGCAGATGYGWSRE